MKISFSLKSIVFLLLLSFLSIPSYSANDTRQSGKSLKKLLKLSSRLFDNMDIVGANTENNQNILDIKGIMGPLAWDFTNLLELQSLSISLHDTRNQVSAKAAFYRNCEYFTASCDSALKELDIRINYIKNKKAKSALEKIVQILKSIKKELKPDIDFYAIEKNRDKYFFSITNEKALELSGYTAELFQNIGSIKQIASHNPTAADIDRALKLYSLHLDYMNITFAMWSDASPGPDKDELFSALGKAIGRVREYYYLTNYTLNLLRVSIDPNDDRDGVDKTAGKIDLFMDKIETFIDPYEEAYVKIDPQAAKDKKAREDFSRSRGLEAEGVYEYSLKNYPKAVEKLKKSIELSPLYGRAHYYLALSFVKSGDFVSAKKALENFIRSAEKNKSLLSIEDVKYLDDSEALLAKLEILK